MKLFWRSLAFALLYGVIGVYAVLPVAAQQPTSAQSNAIKQSCRSDYQANCASVPTGGMASLQCLQQHMSVLSPACQSAVSAVGSSSATTAPGAPAVAAPQAAQPAPGQPRTMSPRQEMAVMRSACGGDFRAYCRGVQMGGGRGLGCLEAHQSQLSPRCKGALASASAR